MNYTTAATAANPASIIYLVACGASMADKLGDLRRIDHINAGIERILFRMIQRSIHGEHIVPRYRIALIPYGDKPVDIFNGFAPMDKIVTRGLPHFSPTAGGADAYEALMLALQMLHRELPQMQHAPAPMVCHFTDGRFEGADPESIVREIMDLSLPDGRVLMQNVFFGEGLITTEDGNAESWSGVTDDDELAGEEAKRIRGISSILPSSYVDMIQEEGFNLQPGSRMLFPGVYKELFELVFTMSGVTSVI